MKTSTSDVFDDIIEFHSKFKLLPEAKGLMEEKLLDFRVKFLKEETKELDDAHLDESLEKALDACIDITYVAIGTMVMMGFSAVEMRKAWFRVHAANMRKVRAKRAGYSHRDFTFDVVKPEGWEPPDLSDLCK